MLGVRSFRASTHNRRTSFETNSTHLMRKLAITGGVAEGKSTVLSYLRELGYTTASSDEISRNVFHSEEVQDGLAALLRMPRPIEAADLRERIWDDDPLRRSVNRLMHPLILQRLDALDVDAIEVPLLFETCLQGHFDRVWVVTCGVEEQRRRLLLRLGNASDVDSILSTQLPAEVKCAFADLIVRTNRASEDVKRFVASMVRRSLG